MALLPPQIPHVEKVGKRVRRIWCMVTAYYPGKECCGPDANGFTSTLVDTRIHCYGIAVAPQLISYHSKIRVPGYLSDSHPDAWWEADDTGSQLRYDGVHGTCHIDVRFRSLRSAREWGIQWLTVEVMDP